jgi:glycosyltransferase involved in cell wall biosynthesis
LADVTTLAGKLPSLSVVIPAFNAAETLPATVSALLDDLDRAGWPDVEVVLVDDGSTDSTAASLDAYAHRCRLVVVSQPNSGRFAARKVGLERAQGGLALLIDSRIIIVPGSMAFLAGEIRKGNDVWNAHVVTKSSSSLPSHFWDAITAMAWRRYYRDPRHVQLTHENFDYFPKGTTLFVAPRELLLGACRQFATEVRDLRLANDDTLLLKPLLDHGVINLAPSFACQYEARSSVASFVRHSFHRGTVLIDGHDRPGSRFRWPIRIALISGPVIAWGVLRSPMAALRAGVLASGALGVVSRLAGADRRASISLGVLAPLFGVSYYSGMARGEVLRFTARSLGRCRTSDPA